MMNLLGNRLFSQTRGKNNETHRNERNSYSCDPGSGRASASDGRRPARRESLILYEGFAGQRLLRAVLGEYVCRSRQRRDPERRILMDDAEFGLGPVGRVREVQKL